MTAFFPLVEFPRVRIWAPYRLDLSSAFKFDYASIGEPVVAALSPRFTPKAALKRSIRHTGRDSAPPAAFLSRYNDHYCGRSTTLIIWVSPTNLIRPHSMVARATQTGTFRFALNRAPHVTSLGARALPAPRCFYPFRQRLDTSRRNHRAGGWHLLTDTPLRLGSVPGGAKLITCSSCLPSFCFNLPSLAA